MLELATSLSVSLRSDLMASGMSGGKANHERVSARGLQADRSSSSVRRASFESDGED